ncbi:MAG: hypothetical protein IJ109_05970 [Firmicutes bacterium]|nr:hypothetical protein [Bacillota bacterium]
MKGRSFALAMTVMLLIITIISFNTEYASAADYATSGISKPFILQQGNGFTIKGTVTSTSKYKIQTATVGVYTPKGSLKTGKTLKVNTKTVNLNKFNSYVNFKKLPTGTYYYQIKIKRNGKTKRILNQKVMVNYSNYVFYSKNYSGYSFQQFGWSMFKNEGCAVTATAMVVSNKKGKKISPDDVYKKMFGSQKRTVCPDLPAWKTVAKKYGLSSIVYTKNAPYSETTIMKEAKKYPQGVICNTGSHYYVAKYGGGSFYYNDPAGYYPLGKTVASSTHIKGRSNLIHDKGSVVQIIVLK